MSLGRFAAACPKETELWSESEATDEGYLSFSNFPHLKIFDRFEITAVVNFTHLVPAIFFHIVNEA